MARVVSFYGVLPIDRQATAAVPRLHVSLLTMLAQAHSDWKLVAISPRGKPLPGVESISVVTPRMSRAKARFSETRVGWRL